MGVRLDRDYEKFTHQIASLERKKKIVSSWSNQWPVHDSEFSSSSLDEFTSWPWESHWRYYSEYNFTTESDLWHWIFLKI